MHLRRQNGHFYLLFIFWIKSVSPLLYFFPYHLVMRLSCFLLFLFLLYFNYILLLVFLPLCFFIEVSSCRPSPFRSSYELCSVFLAAGVCYHFSRTIGVSLSISPRKGTPQTMSVDNKKYLQIHTIEILFLPLGNVGKFNAFQWAGGNSRGG